MIKIEVRPEVELALSAAFPLPKSSARRALRKYVQVMEQLLTQAMVNGRTPEQVKFNTYSISLQRLANLGGQIGPDRKRVHAWLRENGLQLVRTVTQGSNLTGVVSTIKVTELVILVFEAGALTNTEEEEIMISRKSDHVFDEVNEAKSLEVDWLEVDIKSLNAYNQWVAEQSKLIGKEEKQRILLQVSTILAKACSNNGMYPQIRNPSVFGRMYYKGLSIQNVNKELRRAILGNCWEYDIRSSVISWKMGFAKWALDEAEDSRTVRDAFSATISYLEDKADFMRTIRHFTFLEGTHVPKELQSKLLKQAVTAISFGARATTTGWYDMAGTWTNPALVEIIKNPDERKRFLGDATVRQFIQEQNHLDDYIVQSFKSEAGEFLNRLFLLTPSGKVSKSKVLAFYYQHSETQVMDVLRKFAEAHGRKPIANVHDAVFFRDRLGVDLKTEIEYQMQTQTANPYWRLEATQLHAYTPINKEILAFAAEHRARIAEEEIEAAGYISAWTRAT